MTPREVIHAFVLQYAVPQIAARQVRPVPHAQASTPSPATYPPHSAAVCRDGAEAASNLTGAKNV
jgi:hypothetical protein